MDLRQGDRPARCPAQEGARREVEVQAVQVGPAVFVTDPAEYFCRYGLEIKANAGSRSPSPSRWPTAASATCRPRNPSDRTAAANETRLTSYSNLEITAGAQMRDAGIDLARQLKPGAVPEPPRHPPFTGKPWPYGNVPPERN